MYKTATGAWEHDFRQEGVPRYHVSYGVMRKADAERLHAAVVACFRAKQYDVIEAMRTGRGKGRVTPAQLAELVAAGRPFSAALESLDAVAPWPMITDAIAQYLAALEANPNRKQRTAQLARIQLARWAADLERDGPAPDTTRLDEMTSLRVDAYQSAMFADGAKANTVRAYIARVGSLYHWFLRREQRAAAEGKRAARPLSVPLDPETISRTKTRRDRYLSEPEAERVLAATPASMLFPVAAGLFAGLRVEEMLHLRPGFDIDLRVGVLSIQVQPTWSPKTKRSVRAVPIAAVLRPMLERHLAEYASADWLSPSFRSPLEPLNQTTFRVRFQRIVRDAELVTGRADPEGVTFHTLRHTFASWLLMSGTDVFTVSKLLGNTMSQIEDVYGHLAKDFRQAAVDRLSVGLTLPTGRSET